MKCKDKNLEVDIYENKHILICLIILFVWITPAFASNSSSTNSQIDEQQILSHICHIKNQIKSGLKETCHVLIQNKDLKKEVKNIYEHLNKELSPKNRTEERSNITRKINKLSY